LKINFKYSETLGSLNQELDISITRLSEVSVEPVLPGSEEVLELNGNFFVFPDSHRFYYHLMRDYVAQFELLKKTIPDLIPVTLCECYSYIKESVDHSCLGLSVPPYGPHRHILNRYRDEHLSVDTFKYKEIRLSSVFFVYANSSELQKALPDLSYDKVLFNNSKADWLEDQYSKVLLDVYTKSLRPVDAQKKIYISRLKESKVIEDLVSAYDTYLESGTLPADKKLEIEVLDLVKKLPAVLLEFDMKKSRSFSVEDELLLEDYFRSKGYEILSPGDYSVEEQIEIFSSSAVVAGAGGSGMTNLLFCSPSTRVILITAGNLFGYGGHSRIALANGKKVNFFPEIIHFDHDTYSPHIKFTAAEMISLVDNSGVAN